jgi:hypothetical protein
VKTRPNNSGLSGRNELRPKTFPQRLRVVHGYVRFVVLLLLMLLFATQGRAELLMLREHARQMDSGKVAIALDATSFFGRVAAPRYALIAPTLGASLRLSEVVLEAALPFAYVHERNEPGDDKNNMTLGNPWFGLSYLPDCSCGLSRLSLGLAANLATGRAPLDQLALSLATFTQGMWDSYLFTADLLPLVAGASTLMRLGMLHLVWDGDVIVGLPGNARETELGFQNAGDAGLWFGTGVVLGARLHGVYYPTMDGDRFQSAVSAYLRVRLGKDALGVRYVVNLDGPGGYSFREDKVWGLGLFYAATL